MRSGWWLNVSQIDAPRPPSLTAPSIWYAAVAAPHRNPAGNAGIAVSDAAAPARSLTTGTLSGAVRQRHALCVKGPAGAAGQRPELLHHDRAVVQAPRSEDPAVDHQDRRHPALRPRH